MVAQLNILFKRNIYWNELRCGLMWRLLVCNDVHTNVVFFQNINSEFFSSLLTAQPHPKPSSRRETQRQPVSAGLVPRGHEKLPWSEDHQLHHILEERTGLLRSAAPLQTGRDVRNLLAHRENFSLIVSVSTLLYVVLTVVDVNGWDLIFCISFN